MKFNMKKIILFGRNNNLSIINYIIDYKPVFTLHILLKYNPLIIKY